MEAIASSPNLVAEARVHLPALRNQARLPAGTEQIRKIIGRHFETYPQPQRAPAQWAFFWADYEEALKGIPAAAIEEAMRAWVLRPDAEFLPKPGRLRELALTAETPAARAWSIADRASKLEEQRRRERKEGFELVNPRAPAGPKTAEDKAAVKAMAAETAQLLARMPKMPSGIAPVAEREKPSQLYVDLMNDGLRAAREAPPTVMQRIAATLDEKSQGRLAPGRAITPLMVEHRRRLGLESTEEDRARIIREHGGAPVPPGGRDALAEPRSSLMLD